MKSFFGLLTTLFVFLVVSCDQHSWEDELDEEGNVLYPGTKRFYTEHHGASHDEHGESHDDHASGGHDDHSAHAEDAHGDEHKKDDKGHH